MTVPVSRKSVFAFLTVWVGRNRVVLPLAAALALAFAFLASAPDTGRELPYSTVLLDRQGQLLGATVATDQQWRFPPVSVMPERFAEALIAYEDRRFRWHPGVDPIALARAVNGNLRAGRVVSGGSTLTMQVVRLLRGNPPRTFAEKIREAALAVRLSLHLSKNEVLKLYATHAPFGGNVVGVEAASWRYFGRAPEHLSWAEAATLAVLPNAPGLIHPGRSRVQLQAKRDGLLRKLNDSGKLSEVDLRLALLEPLPASPSPFPQLAPHLLHKADWRGRRITSTLLGDLQARAAELMQWHGRQLAEAKVPNAAFVVVENRRHSVLAYVGNSDAANRNDQGQAIDLLHRPRSSGSILKPLLYALMLEQGEILPPSLVADVPTQINGYSPENFDKSYRGAVRADTALALSLNIPAVRLLRVHGVDRFALQLKQMGMTTLFRPAEDYGLTLVLGGAEATLWDLATIYSNLAAIARDDDPEPIYRRLAVDSAEAPPPLARAEFGPGAAYLTLEAMAEVNRPGLEAYWRSFSSSRKVAWKTGTSFGLRDAWAIAVTPDYTVAVWAGNAHGDGVAGLSGTQTAAPLLFDVLNLLPASDWFLPPHRDLKSVAVCRDDGFLPRAGCETSETLAPRNSHFDQGSRWHKALWLDRQSGLRVNAACRLESARKAVSWFELPPGMEFYYRRLHSQYRRVPAWSKDCAAETAPDESIELLYPEPGAVLYIPTEIDGKSEALVAQAVHRNASSIVHWHLDDHYLGSTHEIHQQQILTGYGSHTLTLVDGRGASLSRQFFVKSHQR